MSNKKGPFLGHAPLPMDCQDMEQIEFESHFERDERLRKEEQLDEELKEP